MFCIRMQWHYAHSEHALVRHIYSVRLNDWQSVGSAWWYSGSRALACVSRTPVFGQVLLIGRRWGQVAKARRRHSCAASCAASCVASSAGSSLFAEEKTKAVGLVRVRTRRFSQWPMLGIAGYSELCSQLYSRLCNGVNVRQQSKSDRGGVLAHFLCFWVLSFAGTDTELATFRNSREIRLRESEQ